MTVFKHTTQVIRRKNKYEKTLLCSVIKQTMN